MREIIDRIRRSLLFISHLSKDGRETILGTGCLIARQGRFMLGITAAHVLTGLVDRERRRGNEPRTGLWALGTGDVDLSDAYEKRRFRAHFAGPDNSQGTALIANIARAPNADIGAFVCLASEEHLGHVLEMPINTDIPSLNQEVMIVAPRSAEVDDCGGIGTTMITMPTTVIALHKRYTLLDGPCFEMPVGTDHQASGSPIICATNGDYLNSPFACGILSNSDLPQGAHPLTPPDGDWRTIAALLFPTAALHVRWRTPGQPVGVVSISQLINERVVRNLFKHPLDIHIEEPPFAREFPQVNVVSQQWNNLDLPD